MSKAVHLLLFLLLTGSAAWLFFEEEAAKPGPLLEFHERTATCRDCHIPWQGVQPEKCLGCHRFPKAEDLPREIRFHQAEKYCLGCHREHRGVQADIARMDHTLLHPDLLCSQCHVDPHEGLFSEACRECHRIVTWRIVSYRHPPAEQKACDRCHRPPLSHQDPELWRYLADRFEIFTMGDFKAARGECWQCHISQGWSHLVLESINPQATRATSAGES